jgi:hypothetical protein
MAASKVRPWVGGALLVALGVALYGVHDQEPFREVLPQSPEGFTAAWTGMLFAATWLLYRSTERLAATGEQTATRQMRAYVGVRKMRLLEQTPERAYGYEVWIQNYGQTPAYQVSCSTNRRVLPYPLPLDYAIQEYADQDQLAGSSPTWISLQPGERRRITSSSKDPRLADAEIASFIESKDGTLEQTQLYCFGTVAYRDAFGKQHWAHYCKSFGGDYLKRTGGGSTSHFYNDSSDDPKD